jgi:uncharacterized protein (TIGR02646 family)
MRTIDKRSEPGDHTEWRAANQGDVNYGYDLMGAKLRETVKESLLKEQGWICAYTGRAINMDTSHIEHLLPQKSWKAQRGLDVDYNNMVACWPEPGHKPEPEYGARFKANWPMPGEESLFVSPLSPGCEGRFSFNFRGEIKPRQGDTAAAETIKKLGLDKALLKALRHSEIVGVLGKNRSMKLKDAKARLKMLEDAETDLRQGTDVYLNPYCFALKQELKRHIRTLETIRATTRRTKQ